MSQQLTLGQKRVLKTFNPSGNETVDKIKDLSAQLIDLLESLRSNTPINSAETGTGKSGEGQRVISTAQTKVEDAAMWAVKSVFIE